MVRIATDPTIRPISLIKICEWGSPQYLEAANEAMGLISKVGADDIRGEQTELLCTHWSSAQGLKSCIVRITLEPRPKSMLFNPDGTFVEVQFYSRVDSWARLLREGWVLEEESNAYTRDV